MSRLHLKINERFLLIMIAALVGTGSGTAAVALNRALATVSSWTHYLRNHWYIFLLPGIGAALSVVFLSRIVKDNGGNGVPEVIHSVSQRGGLLRLRTSFSRLVSCLLTIASGGAAGPEAPVVISGASIGSNIASFFRLKDRQRVVIVGCGAAGAIAAIFNAPMTGIVFTLEAIMGEWTSTALIPIAISSVVATEVSRLLQGNQIPFAHRIFDISLADLAACVGLAVFTAFASLLLMHALRQVSKTARMLIPVEWMRAGTGGLCVGAIGLFLPSVLGEGYEPIRTIIEGHFQQGLVVVGILVVAKILATSLTIGSGGSGGLFAPCLMIGSVTGLFYQRLISTLLPAVAWAGEGYFALLGMAGAVSSLMQAPMTGVFLAAEISGSYSILVSVVTVAVVSAAISHFFEPLSIYHQELAKRGEFIRPRTDRRVLSELNIVELLEKDCLSVHPENRLKDLVALIQRTHRNYFPVEDALSGEFLGLVYLDDIRAYLFNRLLYDTVLVEDLMERDVPQISLDDNLVHVFELFENTRSWSLPVVENKKFLGLISKATILNHYRKELMAEEQP